MKRILFCFLSLIITSAVANSRELVEWDSIAPANYVNAVYKENTTFAYNHPVASALSTLTIIGIPFAFKSADKSASINENNYWYKRRVDFEAQRDLCNLIIDNDKKVACFVELRKSELQKTDARKYAETQLEMQQQQLNAINGLRYGY